MPSEEVVITGKIVFGNVAKPFKNATVHVRLEDVSKQDAPSEIIATQIIKNFEITQKEFETKKYRQIEFTLRGRISDWRGMYIVSAHVDVDGDGKIGVGDYITQAYYPVLTHGNPRYVVVSITQVV